MKKRRRVHYLINKRMQLAFIAKFLVVATLFALFFVYLTYITIWPVVSGFVPQYVKHIVKQQVYLSTMLYLIPAVFVLIAFAIAISHRIAGPLYRIERTIEELVRGEDVEYIRLRKKDENELKILASKINDLIALIKKLKEPTIAHDPPPKL